MYNDIQNFINSFVTQLFCICQIYIINCFPGGCHLALCMQLNTMGMNFMDNLLLNEQKPDMFAHKPKFILLPQLVATLNIYACSLPPLAKVDWSAFPECFLPTM